MKKGDTLSPVNVIDFLILSPQQPHAEAITSTRGENEAQGQPETVTSAKCEYLAPPFKHFLLSGKEGT